MSKKILIAIIYTLLFTSCMAKESIPTKENVPPVQDVIVEEAPSVSEPDEDGYFPIISEEEWMAQLESQMEGEADAAPPDEPIVPLLDDENCIAQLKEQYRGVTDWKVLFEEDVYKLMNMYDPYDNCYRQRYVPYRMAVLATEQNTEFDRLIAISYDYCDVEYVDSPTKGYQPHQQTVLLTMTGQEEQWKLGDLSKVLLVSDENEKSFSLWLPEQEAALLVQVEMDYCSAQIAFHVTEQPPLVTEFLSLAKSQHGGADWLLDVKVGEETKRAYYRTADQTLHYFEDSSLEDTLPCLFESYYMGIIHEEYIHFYDLTAENPGEIVKTLGGEGRGLSQNEIILDRNSVILDFGDFSTHSLCYYEKDGEFWKVACLDSRGNVQNLIETNLPAPQDGVNYIENIDLLDGILSFNFHRSDESSEPYYMDIRPGMDNRVYSKELEFQLGLDENSRMNMALGDKIGMWTLDKLDVSNDPEGNLSHLVADFSGWAKLSGVVRRHPMMDNGYEFIVDSESRNTLPCLVTNNPTKDRLSVSFTRSSASESDIAKMEYGEELACTIYIESYRHVFAYSEAQDSVNVTRIELAPPAEKQYTAQITAYESTEGDALSDEKLNVSCVIPDGLTIEPSYKEDGESTGLFLYCGAEHIGIISVFKDEDGSSFAYHAEAHTFTSELLDLSETMEKGCYLHIRNYTEKPRQHRDYFMDFDGYLLDVSITIDRSELHQAELVEDLLKGVSLSKGQ